MKNIDSLAHVRGESLYIDDLPVHEGTLYGYVFDSPVAKGKINKLDLSEAINLTGVVRIFTHKDIPGQNQIGIIIQDENLFAENEVHFIGQPIAFIVADSEITAKKAKKLIQIEIEEEQPVTDAREAFEKGHLIAPSRSFKLGNTEQTWQICDYIFEGQVNTGSQEHLYLETQGAYSIPLENGNIRISSATQGPTAVQKIASRVLGIPMHKIEVDVIRIGGGFGGKEDQATAWAVMTSLAVFHLKKPVKYCLQRPDDMRMTGKRHPYSVDYKIGLNKDLKIMAYQAVYYQNAGAAADLSPAIIDRTLFHGTNVYFIPNVGLTAHSCRTNLPPNTAFRGFGAPQGVFTIESAIAHAAEYLKIEASRIQKINLIVENDEFSYGQIALKAEAENCWKQLDEKVNFKIKKAEVEKFNIENHHFKRGMAIMPICFGISFTNTVMNHARALVHIYQDGSVGISTGAVEMGQSVNTRLIQVAQHVFGISADKIKIESTNTSRVANTSPSAASSTADLNGKALEIACNNILYRLKTKASEILNADSSELKFADNCIFYQDKKSGIEWQQLVEKAFLGRINLSETAHYSTPKIHFDRTQENGQPFAYHVYGTACFIAEIDCIRGTSKIKEVSIVHDSGKSMNINIDKGQIEGAVVQSIGWMTMEEIIQNKKGQLVSNALSSYKIPDIYSVPEVFEIDFLNSEGHEMAVLKSKAIGEPPFIYGIGAFFAIQNAIKAFNPNSHMTYDTPYTPERILFALYKPVSSA